MLLSPVSNRPDDLRQDVWPTRQLFLSAFHSGLRCPFASFLFSGHIPTGSGHFCSFNQKLLQPKRRENGHLLALTVSKTNLENRFLFFCVGPVTDWRCLVVFASYCRGATSGAHWLMDLITHHISLCIKSTKAWYNLIKPRQWAEHHHRGNMTRCQKDLILMTREQRTQRLTSHREVNTLVWGQFTCPKSHVGHTSIERCRLVFAKKQPLFPQRELFIYRFSHDSSIVVGQKSEALTSAPSGALWCYDYYLLLAGTN